MVIALWILFSFIVGAIGSGKKIGFFGAFILSLILSPIIGLIIALVSKSKEDEKLQKELLKTQKQQQETLTEMKEGTNNVSIPDELKKLQEMKDAGQLTEDEFQQAKTKLLTN